MQFAIDGIFGREIRKSGLLIKSLRLGISELRNYSKKDIDINQKKLI